MIAAHNPPTDELDPLDSKILWVLDLDGRVSLSALARQLKQSQQIVSFRYHRLRRRGYIKGAITLVNIHLIGQLTFRVYFRLREMSRDIEERLQSFIVRRPDVLWFAQLRGSWDYEVVFRVRDYIEFGRIWKEVQAEFGRFYERSDISMTTVTYHFRRDYLVKNVRREFAPAQFGKAVQVVSLSPDQQRLLEFLAQNARASFSVLQRTLKLSYASVREELKALETSGVIQGYRMAPDIRRLGRHYLKALIKLNYEGPKEEEKLYRFCAQFPFITYLSDVLGSWEFEIECEVANHGELHEMLRELRRRFSGMIKDYEIVEVAKELMLSYVAKQ